MKQKPQSKYSEHIIPQSVLIVKICWRNKKNHVAVILLWRL